jgi:hypothetical protein
MTAIELTKQETLELVFSSLNTIQTLADDCDGKVGKKVLLHNLSEIRRVSARAVRVIESYEPPPEVPVGHLPESVEVHEKRCVDCGGPFRLNAGQLWCPCDNPKTPGNPWGEDAE